MSIEPDPRQEPSAPRPRSKLLARAFLIGLGLLALAYAAALIVGR